MVERKGIRRGAERGGKGNEAKVFSRNALLGFFQTRRRGGEAPKRGRKAPVLFPEEKRKGMTA